VKNLQEADLVLCDVSTINANVFFELGIRTALDKPIVFVRDNLTQSVPFDAAIMNFHTYDARLALWSIEEEIANLARHITEVAERAEGRNHLWKYFGLTERAEPPDVDNPLESKVDLILQEIQGGSSPRQRSQMNARVNAGAVLEPGFWERLRRTDELQDFIRMVDDLAKRRRTQIILTAFDNELLVDLGKDIFLSEDIDRLQMASLLLQPIKVEFSSAV